MKYIINTALPYSEEDSLHLGHLYSTFIGADILKRSLIKLKHKVILLGGTDDHGLPNLIKQIQTKQNINDILNYNQNQIYNQLIKFDISFDIFQHTFNNKIHTNTVIKIFKQLQLNNQIKKKFTKNIICNYCKLHLSKKTIIIWCNKCEKKLDSEIYLKHECKENNIQQYCPLCKNNIQYKLSQEIFLQLKKNNFNQLLKQLQINDNGQTIIKEIIQKKQHYNSWKVISRNSDFGIQIPGYINKTFYVWFDAILSYISFINKKYKNFKKIFFMGKDNVFFHTYFLSNILPKNFWPDVIFARNWLITEKGEKISKTQKNSILLKDINKEQTSVLRLFLFQLNSNNDVKFKIEDLKIFEKNIFINQILNLFQRSIQILQNLNLNVIYKTKNYKINLYFFQLITNMEFNTAYSFFIEKVKNNNIFFNQNKLWENKNMDIIINWLEKLNEIYEYLEILTPNIITKINIFFTFTKNKIIFKDNINNSHILYTKQF